MKKQVGCLLLSLLLLTGCGRDAAQLTVVTGIGVDGLPGEYHVCAEVIRLTDQNEGSKSVHLSADGLTVTDSIDSMVSMTGRTLYCNHTQVLVISRETAENGLKSLLEELLRGTQYPISLRIAVAKDSAAKTMRTKPVVSDLHSVELEDMIREGAKQCLTPDVDVCSFYQEVSEPGVEGILPFLELKEGEQEPACSLAGTALFQGERMLSVLDSWDSRCLMWMRGETGGTLVTEHAVFEVVGLERDLEATARSGKLKLKLTLKASDDEENKEQLMGEAKAAMENQCRSLLKRLQELQCDAVGFGNRIYQKHPGDWKQLEEQWPQHFSAYPISVEVEIGNMIWGRIWSSDGQQELEEDSHGS